MSRFRFHVIAGALLALAACDEAAAPAGTPGDVSVRAYVDRDASGSFTTGDSSLAGVQVTATPSEATGGESRTATTNSGGIATFEDVPPGSYTIAVTGGEPVGAVLTTNPAPTVGVSFQGTVTGSAEFRYSFFPGTVSGRIFRDDDASGGYSTGDVVGAGLTVNLRADTGATAPGAIVATTTTDAAGAFTFTLLAPGSYWVELENPTTISYGAAGALRRVTVGPQGTISVPAIFTGSLVSPIAEVRGRTLGSSVAVVGRLTVAPGSFTSASGGVNGVNSELWVQDATGGIAVFPYATENTLGLALGDSVQVSGALSSFAGQLQIGNPVVINKRASGAVPAPRVISGAQLIARTYEGQLVQVQGFTVTSVQTGTATSFNVTGTSPDGQTFVLRITGPTTSGVIVQNSGLTRADFVVGQRYNVTGIATVNISTATPPVTTIQIKPRMRSDVVLAPLATPARVIINEFMANPATTTDPAGEYIELYNAGGTAQDLTGWRLVDYNGATGVVNGADTIGTSSPTPTPLVIEPGEHLLLVHTSTVRTGAFAAARYGYAANIQLNNTGTQPIVLKNAAGETVDSIAYTSPVGTGAGIARGVVDPSLDNTSAATNWSDQTTVFATVGTNSDRGTPGTRNDGAVIPAPAQLRATTRAALTTSRSAATQASGSATPRR